MNTTKRHSRNKLTGERDSRSFEVVVYERDYQELCSWVLRHKNIETGGDLFGLWSDDRKAVIQLVLGPGKDCRRTESSFFQDVEYLKQVGSYLTTSEGLCHIGEWHSHHQLGLAQPSSGDESTVWNNMPTYGLDRFVIFIANIEQPRMLGSAAVNVGCFLFEYETGRRGKKQLSVLQGRFTVLTRENPFGDKKAIRIMKEKHAEKPPMTAEESGLIQCDRDYEGSGNKNVRSALKKDQQEYKKHSDKQSIGTDPKKKRRKKKGKN